MRCALRRAGRRAQRAEDPERARDEELHAEDGEDRSGDVLQREILAQKDGDHEPYRGLVR
jgi:hypothetical protein